MASGTFYPAVNADDGHRNTGGFSTSASSAPIGNGGGWTHNLFVRFPSVTIPQGAVITGAFIRFTAYNSNANVNCNLNCYFEDSNNAAAPTDAASFDALALTGAVAWNGVAAWTDGVQYDTPSLISILQNIINKGDWSSGNAVQIVIKNNSSTANAVRYISTINYVSGAEKAELHVTWDALSVEITDGVGIADTYASVVLAAIIAEAFGLSDSCEGDLASLLCEITDGCGINDTLARSFETFNSITDGVGIADVMAGFFEFFATITNNTGIADAYARFIEISKSIQDDAGIADLHEVIRVFNKTQSETLSSWDTLKWGWRKSIADSMAIAETVSKILGIPIKDWLVLTDTESNNWNGSEAISDSLFILDISKAVKVYADLIADGMAVVDAVNIALELMITDILTCTDTVLNIGTFTHSIADSMTLEDIVKRAFPKSVSDSFAITDTSLIDFLVLLQISDSLAITETTTPGLTISQTIADALDVLDTVTIKQLLQELIQDGLNIDVSVVVDGEIWECWVLNTSAFHPSVYSGYDYNSFALFNNVAYGCKSDGIYELAGDTDNGTAFHSGIILPETRFGLAHNKRFRKAYFGVSGDDLVMKMKTDNGWRTFRMTDTEMSITRDLKGRKWEISLEDFDELDSISLIPVILSRK